PVAYTSVCVAVKRVANVSVTRLAQYHFVSFASSLRSAPALLETALRTFLLRGFLPTHELLHDRLHRKNCLRFFRLQQAIPPRRNSLDRQRTERDTLQFLHRMLFF